MDVVNNKNEVAAFVAQKIKEFLDMTGISQREAAERLKTSPQNVNNYLKGSQPFGAAVAQKWHDAFGFRVNWLRTGEGPMFEESSVNNNNAGGDMVINSPGTVISSEGGDVRVYKDLYEKAQNEIIELKAKVYKLMDRLSALGEDCEC